MIRSYALFRVFESMSQTKHPESMTVIAKRAGVGLTSAKRVVDYLADYRLVKRTPLGRMILCELDRDNVLVRHLKASLSLGRIHEVGLIEELLKKNPAILSVILFGSVARGTDMPDSDVDIVIISRSNVSFNGLKSEKVLDREVSWMQFTPSQWKVKARDDKAFYDNVVIGGIAIHGEIPVVR
ncbi:MAG: nucleotidyltransferase domain-containing protein [Nanoarchaeota archaeon]